MRLSKTMMFEASTIADAEKAGIKINEFCEKALVEEADRRFEVTKIDNAKMLKCPNPGCGLEFSSLIWEKKPELKGKCYSCGAEM